MKPKADRSSTERIQALREILRTQQLDLIIAYSNRFESSMAMAFSGVACRSAGNYFFCTEDDVGFLEVEYKAVDLRGRAGLSVIDVPDENMYGQFLANYCRSVRRIGILGPAPFQHFVNVRSEILDISEHVWPVLRRKTVEEIADLSRGYTLLTGIFGDIEKSIVAGVTEQDIEKRLRSLLLTSGDALSFDPLVVSGERLQVSTFGSATDRVLCEGDYVCVDAGLVLNGLYTDCTRMYRVGTLKSSDTLKRFQRAHKHVIESLTRDQTCASLVDLYYRELSRVGLPADTMPAVDLGHFIGFMLHEPPFFVTKESDQTRLSEGAVFCLEPQITVDGVKMRIEDMVSIQNGRGRVLSELCKKEVF